MKKIYYLTAIFIVSTVGCNQCKKPPKVTTNVEATEITDNSANIKGMVTDDGNAAITEYGFYYSTSQNPQTSDDKVPKDSVNGKFEDFSAALTGLNPNTKYYFKAYAINSEGTGYGNEVSFTTTNIVDIDGNIYTPVTIGAQTWMKENLKVTKYRDGSSIPNVTDNTEWLALTTGAYCWYSNDANTYKDTYGGLYNWYAVTDNRKLCPSGWHVPTDAEWNILIEYLGGKTVAGGKLKETGTAHWSSPNSGADNSSGFTGLPAGYRYGGVYGTFYQINRYEDWWASDIAHYRGVYNNNTSVTGDEAISPSTYGFSVRCLKDI